MQNQELVVTSSPHLREKTSVAEIMWTVNLSLIPVMLAASYFFGLRALVIIAVSIISCVLTEYIFLRVRNLEVTLSDGSAVVTGILLALTMPPTIPLWVVAIAAVVAITLGKQVFGGLGKNPFNPALIGRAFVTAAYPVLITTWTFDGQTAATPLNLKMMEGEITPYWNLFIGNIPGSLGETSAFLILLGAALLIYKGYLNWRIPAGMLSTVFLSTWLMGQDPVFHLLAGSLLLGAFYYATDMVTTPVTTRGRWIFGVGVGIFVVIIRLWGGYPEGVMYSILLMNMTVPLINRFTRPRSLGEVK